jgi:hypothetical protein
VSLSSRAFGEEDGGIPVSVRWNRPSGPKMDDLISALVKPFPGFRLDDGDRRAITNAGGGRWTRVKHDDEAKSQLATVRLIRRLDRDD